MPFGEGVLALDLRVGTGYDVHPLQANRDLILGGIRVPYHLGLMGHSDADVLLHAVIDALLGAAALGDIGSHFPPTDQRYEGISSLTLLEEVRALLQQRGYSVVNLDSTIVAENPRFSPYLEGMCENIARGLGISKNAVSVKATTTESLGFTGRGEGIAAYAVVLIHRPGG